MPTTNITHNIKYFINKYHKYIIIILIASFIRYLMVNSFLPETFLNSNKKGNMNTSTIFVERVTTPETIAKGLMFRKEPLAQGHGMLFDKGTWSTSGFWMKNTYFPLDILFLDDTFTVIDILYDMKPLDTTSRNINKPWRYAIEINASSMPHVQSGSQINIIE